MRESWNEHDALLLLQQWINERRWRGTSHFRKYNSSLYEFLYRTIGMHTAFEKLGLDYSDFKKSKGKCSKIRSDEEVISDLHDFIKAGKWEGARHLSRHDSLFHRELSRIGFSKAFEKLGLDYRAYRYAVWSKSDILHELEQMIKNGEWQGVHHLKIHNSKLYNAIVREFGFPNAFNKLGLNYENYRLYHRK